MVNIGESFGLVKELNNENADYIFLEYPLGQYGFDTVSGTAGSALTYYFVPRFVVAVLYGNGFE